MKGGFIQIILIFILFIVILSLLGVSLSSLFNNQTLRDNFSFLWNWTGIVWNHYLKGPAEYAWNLFVTFIFEPIKEKIGNVNPQP